MEFEDFTKDVLIDPLQNTIGSKLLGVRILLTMNYLSKNMKNAERLGKIYTILKLTALGLFLIPVIFANPNLFNRLKNVLGFLGAKMRVVARILAILLKGFSFNIFIPLFVSFCVGPLGLTFQLFTMALRSTALSGSQYVSELEGTNNKEKNLFDKITNMFRFKVETYFRLFTQFLMLVKSKLVEHVPILQYVVNFFKKAILYIRKKFNAIRQKMLRAAVEANSEFSLGGALKGFGSLIFKAVFGFLFRGIIGKILGGLLVFLVLSSKKIQNYIRQVPFLNTIFNTLRSKGKQLLKVLKIDKSYSELENITKMSKAGKLVWSTTNPNGE